ncbi:MAG: hypothetical protein ABIW84_04670 [Ilumatobacteraceae bacterium]
MAQDPKDRGLAPVYTRVVALRDAGASDEAIARYVGCAVEAVPTLIELAVRKLAQHAHASRP